jgi:hypothetical protein
MPPQYQLKLAILSSLDEHSTARARTHDAHRSDMTAWPCACSYREQTRLASRVEPTKSTTAAPDASPVAA